MSNSVSVRADSGFLFLDLRTTEGKSELRRQIACQVGTRFRGSQLTAPAERLVGLIEARRYATAILERAYIDIDHRAALARFYRLRHRDTGGRCVRVHLFECWIDESKLECLTDDEIRYQRRFDEN